MIRTPPVLTSLALGDWNGDSEVDVLLVTKDQIWHYQQEKRDFVELHRNHSPLRRLSSTAEAAFVDVDGDGISEVVLLDNGSIKCFKHNGTDLVLRENPFKHAKVGEVPEKMLLIADVDGDGDLDIVRSRLDGGISYYQQEHGHFQFVSGSKNPFYAVGEIGETCPSLVDYDGDQKVDLVLGSTSGHFKYFQQVNGSFQEVKGIHNPFRNVHVNLQSSAAACASFADLDGDGNLDMLVSSGFVYKSSNGSLLRMPNVFSEVDWKPFSIPTLVDFFGDGSHDLIIQSSSKMSHYTRGTCITPSCNVCDMKHQKCICPEGMDGPQCTQCAKFYYRDSGGCKKCPGYGTETGTCWRRGVCQDDEMNEMSAISNFSHVEHLRSLGDSVALGLCRCLSPFAGIGCEEGQCPSGQFLHTDADISLRSRWYPQWQACMPCTPGRFKEDNGNGPCSDCEAGRHQSKLGQTACYLCSPGRAASTGQAQCEMCPLGKFAKLGSVSCRACPAGFVATEDRSDCMRCDNGTYAVNGSKCINCKVGYLAGPFREFCAPCPAGFAPDLLNNLCAPCEPGKYAAEGSRVCSFCPRGSIPDFHQGQCSSCKPHLYALPGESECRPCDFPSVLGKDKVCSALEPVLFLLTFIATVVFSFALCWIRLRCLTSHLKNLKEMHDYEELHLMKASYLEYGLWRNRAESLIVEQKRQLCAESRRLGISLAFALDELQGLYLEKAHATEWRRHESSEITHPGFAVKIRERDEEDGAGAWESLDLCIPPNNPNFYQLAGLLSYGPSALGKHKICPRDGMPDCSIVDALRKDERSGPANWYLSWTWCYTLQDVCAALSRWWETYFFVVGEEAVYLWWCFFVNNQFRMLQDGKTEDTESLLEVFAKPLENAGKVLMCMDKFENCSYTKRIWCIFEVFSAVRRSIPITLIMPGLDIHQIHQPIGTLKELRRACHVNAEEAGASVKADEEKIKAHIVETMTTFEHVNQTVEQALWIEVIKMIKAQRTTDNMDNINVEGSVMETADRNESQSQSRPILQL